MNVKIKRLHEAAVIPQYAHDYDSGVDLVATEDVIVEPGETVKVPTGIAISLPAGYEAQVRPRSGITLKTKLRVALGTIDAGYVGEIGVIVDNIAPITYRTITDDEGERYEPLYTKVIFDINNRFVPHISEEYLDGTYVIRKGDRIGQLVFNKIEHVSFIEVEELNETKRGEGGFGSSGTSV